MDAPDPAAARENSRALLFLFLAAAPLAEILSENTPLLAFLKPPAVIVLTLVYGLPVVLIRELAVARRLAVPGILLLGLAYGLFNEGIIAKTLTKPSGEPVGVFAGYGLAGQIQTGWSLMIVPWHALHSVFYPILIAHWLFPKAATRRWLSGRMVKLMLAVLIFGYLTYFLNPVRRDAGPFICFAAATAACLWGSLRFRGASIALPAEGYPRLQPALLGAAMTLFTIFQYNAPKHLPFVAFAAVTIAFYVLGLRQTLLKQWRPLPDYLLFGAGDDLVFSVVAALACVVHHRAPVEAGIAGLALAAAFMWLIRAVRRNPNGRGA